MWHTVSQQGQEGKQCFAAGKMCRRVLDVYMKPEHIIIIASIKASIHGSIVTNIVVKRPKVFSCQSPTHYSNYSNNISVADRLCCCVSLQLSIMAYQAGSLEEPSALVHNISSNIQKLTLLSKI